MSLYVLFQKSYESSHWKEKSEADGSILACSLGCFTTARRLALKIFMETTHPAGGSKRNCVLFARMPEARLPKGNRLCGVTPGDGHPCTHRCQGRAAARQELRTGCFGKRSGGAPPQQPLQVALSATRAIRGAGHSQADAPASARPPEDAGVRVTCSDHWGEQRSGSESPGSCRFKGRGRSREAARSFWLPEPAPSAAARPRPLPEGAHGSGRLSADCRKLNLSS